MATAGIDTLVPSTTGRLMHMYDDRLDELGQWGYPYASPSDDRLHHLVYVDGRLVDSWTDSVLGSRWEEHARRFDDERTPVCHHPEPRPPAHVQVIGWLCGLVGGPVELDALIEERPVGETLVLGDPEDATAFGAVGAHLDRVGGLFFDAEVTAVLQRALALLWTGDPGLVRGPTPANEVAAGVVWVVGRANGLFGGGLTQTTIQRELWVKQPLATSGQRVSRVLRGIDLFAGTRPPQAPDLRGFANAALLTPATRRTLIRWRDQARAAEPALVLPVEVESGACQP